MSKTAKDVKEEIIALFRDDAILPLSDIAEQILDIETGREVAIECKEYDSVTGLCDGLTIGNCYAKCSDGKLIRPCTFRDVIGENQGGVK